MTELNDSPAPGDEDVLEEGHSTLQDEMEADADAKARGPDTPEEALSARALGLMAIKARDRVAFLEEDLKTAKADLKELLEHKLPQRLQEMDLLGFEFQLEDGSTKRLALEFEVQGALSRAKDPALAERILTESGVGEVITTEVLGVFSGEMGEEAGDFADSMAGIAGRVKVERKVHASTLKAFVRERLRADPTFDSSQVGCAHWPKVKIQ